MTYETLIHVNMITFIIVAHRIIVKSLSHPTSTHRGIQKQLALKGLMVCNVVCVMER